jgi:lysophospholipase L1-like esterase
MKFKTYLIFLILSFILVSCSGGGGGGGSNSNTAPPVPENIMAVGGNDQIRLSWGNVYGATTYNIYWSTTSGNLKRNGTKISSVTNPYYHTNLSNGIKYYYIVTAVNQYGESGESLEVSATPSLTNPPLPPMNIATLSLDRKVIIRWTEANTDSTGIYHNIYWSTSSGVTKLNGTKIDDSISPYTHTDLINGTTYYYVVTSVNNYGESIESQEISATPDQGNVPSPPTLVTATAGDRQATISWNNVDNAISYNIYWSTLADVSSSSGTKIENVTSPYIHTNTQQGLSYYYVVTAVNGYGESADSNIVSLTIPDSRNDIAVAMGDSITAGYVGLDNHADCYVSVLYGLWGKTVVNQGVGGVSSSYGAAIVNNVINTYNPKYLIIFYGTIDASFYSSDWTIDNLRSIIERAKENGTIPVIATLTPNFGDWAWRNKDIYELNAKIRQLAAIQGIACADIEYAVNWNSDYFASDGLHPNSSGHRIIANTFYNALTR